MNPHPCPTVLIFMGVTGTGKSTVGALFAKKSGAAFFEGDDFHSLENIEKMRNGLPLTDADRAPWLAALRDIIVQALATNTFTVLTCSALKASYRETLAAGDPRVQFVHLTGSPEVIAARLQNRPGHFMPPALLSSQLATLEPPTEALVFSCEEPPESIAAKLLYQLNRANGFKH